MKRWNIEIVVGPDRWVPTDGPVNAANPWTAVMRLMRGLHNKGQLRGDNYIIYVRKAPKEK